ncbi:MAG: relaxase/mobilization nuclease domain-containing protein [Lachnospiraceae bacterium]|nr:relaxase/mobilization nuclease domain-containing protein [Lachnospiraceae bacterium]
MAITKMMHMKASSKTRIDIHLEHSINYILQPKKLGEANLAGGINCLPEMAYRQMKATKQMFGKTGGRQGYHFVISLKPGEGTPEIMYDIAMRFAEEAFAGEYEAVVAVHTDREHLHAHIIINSVNMVTGYKFQCRDGDWKYKFQPITNKLCEEYGLHITPAEYSKEPKNMARPQWEREQAFSKWIKQDVLFCAISAENMEHFIFLLEKLGFEVKQGKHIAVKVPGMKRFKRLDTISEDLSRESLEAMFRYGDASLASPINRTVSLLPVRKAVLTPYQRKCYARMYRLRMAEKKRFTYKSAYLYEQIRKMHELQEEYLVVVKYDVKSYGDLFRLKLRLQQVDEELCKAQKEMYRDRALQKRYCKTAQDLEFFEASEADYRERLDQIKLQKKDNRKKLKEVERCLERDGSLLEAELEMRIPVDDMVDLVDVEKDEVPGNPYRVQEDVVDEKLITEPFVEAITDAIFEDEIIAEVEEVVETAAADVGSEPEIVVVDDEIIGKAELDETENVVPNLENDEIHKSGDTMKLPSDKTEYMRMDIAEKVRCYPFDDKGTDAAFEMIQAYFEKIGMDTSFHSVYEESKLLTDYYEKQKAEEFIGERAERVIETMKLFGINSSRITEYSADVLSEVFGFGDMEYFAGIKLFNNVIDRLGVDIDLQRRYEVFDRIYEEGMREKKFEQSRNSR